MKRRMGEREQAPGKTGTKGRIERVSTGIKFRVGRACGFYQDSRPPATGRRKRRIVKKLAGEERLRGKKGAEGRWNHVGDAKDPPGNKLAIPQKNKKKE